MAVIKEWNCLAHGSFDADSAVCPHGCTTVVTREFRTAPAGRSDKTKAADRALERLAKSYGMSDISNRNGSVASTKRGGGEALWGVVPKGGVFHQGGRIEDRAGSAGGAASIASAYHTGALGGEPTATEAVPLPLGALPPPPRPRIYKHDTTPQSDVERAFQSAS